MSNVNSNVSHADLLKQIEALKAQNAALSAVTARALSLKVSAKNAVSVYGVQTRFPVTLYASQWEKLAEFMPQIIAFIKANDGKLARKTGAVAA